MWGWPRLVSVGGNVLFEKMPGLTTLSLPALATVGDTLSDTEVSVEVRSMPALERLGRGRAGGWRSGC